MLGEREALCFKGETSSRLQALGWPHAFRCTNWTHLVIFLKVTKVGEGVSRRLRGVDRGSWGVFDQDKVYEGKKLSKKIFFKNIL